MRFFSVGSAIVSAHTQFSEPKHRITEKNTAKQNLQKRNTTNKTLHVHVQCSERMVSVICCCMCKNMSRDAITIVATTILCFSIKPTKIDPCRFKQFLILFSLIFVIPLHFSIEKYFGKFGGDFFTHKNLSQTPKSQIKVKSQYIV